MSYRNPKAAPINTGAAVYKGINKLAGDVLSFANKERDRKGQLIADSLADSQAVDDNINKAGIKTSKDGSTGLGNQLSIKSIEVKNKMGAQYDILNKTFSSPAARAKAKAEIARLKKYPEELAGEMATGQYLVDQWNESRGKKNGTIGSISLSNDLDVMGVIKDLQSGGSNTTIEDKDGGRVLVTTSKGETFKLNISDITQSLKANPEQSLFKKVVDDKADVDMYMSQLGFGKGVTKETLIENGHLESLGKRTIAGKEVEVFGIDNNRLATAAKGLSKDLVDDGDNYVYASSVWQDHMGENGTIKEAIKATSREEVLGKIQDHYVKKATKQAELNLGFTLGLPKPPKPEKATKATAAEIKQNEYNVKVKDFAEDAKKGGFFDKITAQVNKPAGDYGPYTQIDKDKELRELLSSRGLSVLPIYGNDGQVIPGVLSLSDGVTKKKTEISSKNTSRKEIMDAILVMQGIKPADIKTITRDPLAPIQ
jgi:hypothetical protein